MSYPDCFNCIDCGVNTGEINEYYMVYNFLWWGVVRTSGMLCIGCLENRLKRKLTKYDFPKLPVNNENDNKKSERLKDRLNSG